MAKNEKNRNPNVSLSCITYTSAIQEKKTLVESKPKKKEKAYTNLVIALVCLTHFIINK